MFFLSPVFAFMRLRFSVFSSKCVTLESSQSFIQFSFVSSVNPSSSVAPPPATVVADAWSFCSVPREKFFLWCYYKLSSSAWLFTSLPQSCCLQPSHTTVPRSSALSGRPSVHHPLSPHSFLPFLSNESPLYNVTVPVVSSSLQICGVKAYPHCN